MKKPDAYIEIQGQIERITYYNDENHYTIAKVKIKERPKPVTVVGTLFSVTPGEELKLSGYWDNHPRYGEQFRVVAYTSIIPATIKGIEKYIGSGMIKGIGPVMAERLVARFGVEVLNIIENDIEKLNEVSGIGEKRIEMIKNAWAEQKDVRDVMIFLQGYGVSPAYAVKIYKEYGRDAIKVIHENPYRLATEIFGIGFITADRIAEKIGISKDSQKRVEAGVLHILQRLADEGHVFYPLNLLSQNCIDLLEIDENRIIGAIEALKTEGKIVVEDRDDSRAVYLTSMYICENDIASRLQSLMKSPKQMNLIDIHDVLESVEKPLSIQFSENQKDAVRASIENKVVLVTGGPGTGKTTIINGIIHVHKIMGHAVLLAAPTGRAAKRITEATGYEAKTIHRLLEYRPGKGIFKRDETNPLEADLIIVDEASMVDVVLMYHFLKAVPDGATIILVGDVDQLPSVGPGNVLKDMIDSDVLPTVRLNKIFRQPTQSMIVINAHRINKGQMPIFIADEGRMRDCHFFPIDEPEKVVKKVIDLCVKEIPERYGYDSLNDIQVLTPMHKGVAGVSNLNEILQKHLNPSSEEPLRGTKHMSVGDKVMQIRNNYDKDVYNGDIGRITVIDREIQELKVDYDGRIVTYDFSELDEIILAYAISVHKSQGSEYPVVIIPVLTQHYVLLQRNLLYTALTRGKKLAILIGTRKALAIAIKNDKPQKRYTLLRERIITSMERKQ